MKKCKGCLGNPCKPCPGTLHFRWTRDPPSVECGSEAPAFTHSTQPPLVPLSHNLYRRHPACPRSKELIRQGPVRGPRCNRRCLIAPKHHPSRNANGLVKLLRAHTQTPYARQILLPQHLRPHQSPPPKKRAGNSALIFLQGKSSRQDRRRSEKYELTTENTNNPSTAKPKIITITGVPSKHPFTLQPAAHFPPLRFQSLIPPHHEFLSNQLNTPPTLLQHSAPQS
jgi:hypothetical protein